MDNPNLEIATINAAKDLLVSSHTGKWTGVEEEALDAAAEYLKKVFTDATKK